MRKSRAICIGDTSLSGGPPYLIAEAGVNHNGDLARALDLVDVAADAGANAVKFQMFEASSLARRDAPSAAYQKSTSRNQFEMLSDLELSRSAFEAVATRARDRQIEFLCTPFSIEAATFLVDVLDVPAIKISSGDLTYSQLLRFVASTGRVLLLSTGMATLAEIRKALSDSDGTDIVLLHCVSQYPAIPAQANIAAIDTLRELTGDPVGFSDHSVELAPSIVAVAFGARVLERHFTIDRTLPGPDHKASMDPAGLQTWVAEVHAAHECIGDANKAPQPSEHDVRLVSRRSLVAKHTMRAGAVVSATDLTSLRPADGISPQDLDRVVGVTLRRDVKVGRSLQWDDLAK